MPRPARARCGEGSRHTVEVPVEQRHEGAEARSLVDGRRLEGAAIGTLWQGEAGTTRGGSPVVRRILARRAVVVSYGASPNRPSDQETRES